MSLPPSPTESDKRMWVIAATESSKFDAINMYDRMILSVGVDQYGEAGQYSVSDILGHVEEAKADLINTLLRDAPEDNLAFRKNAAGKYRFFVNGGAEVTNVTMQQELFWGASPQDWSDMNKMHAKMWAAAVATLLQDPIAQAVQRTYVAQRLMGFVTHQAATILFAPGLTSSPQLLACQAAYLSFAANLPAVASEHLLKYVETAGMPLGLADSALQTWVGGLLQELTFGPNISIYPIRYRAIKPVIERLYGVSLPDFSQQTEDHTNVCHGDCPPSTGFDITTVVGLQDALLKLGYDLGPAGADGVAGSKTLAAVEAFQAKQGLQVDGKVGPNTRAALAKALAP